MSTIRVKKLHPNATLPTYGSADAVGADLYACLEEAVTIQPGEVYWVPTGIALEVPIGCAGLVYARSSMGAKRGLLVDNSLFLDGVDDGDQLFFGNGRLVILSVTAPKLSQQEQYRHNDEHEGAQNDRQNSGRYRHDTNHRIRILL